MPHIEDFRKKTCPAYGELEHEYFSRISAEYVQEQKHAIRQVRHQKLARFFNRVIGK